MHEVRAYNANGDNLYVVADTDARVYVEFESAGEGFDHMESMRSGFRWDADRGRFVRNRVAYFRFDDEVWTRAQVAEYSAARAERAGTPTRVSVDVVDRGKALVVLSDRDGGQLLREDGVWLAEDSYGSGRVVARCRTLRQAAAALARHLGVAGRIVVEVERDPGVARLN